MLPAFMNNIIFWILLSFTLIILMIVFIILFILLKLFTHAFDELKAKFSGTPICIFAEDTRYAEWKPIKPEAGMIEDKDYGTFIVNEQGSYIDRRTKNVYMFFDAGFGSGASVKAFKMSNDLYKVFQDESKMNEIRKICHRLKIPYLGFSTLLNMYFPNGKKLNGFISHGAGGGRKPGSKLNRLDEIRGKFSNLDFTALGHTHDLVTRPIVTLYQDGSSLESRILHAASTGSFLRNYVPKTLGYGERALYDPLPIGYVTLPIRGGEINEGFRYKIIH